MLSLRRRCAEGVQRETAISVEFDVCGHASVGIRDRRRAGGRPEWRYGPGTFIFPDEIDEAVAALLAAKKLIADGEPKPLTDPQEAPCPTT